MSPESTHSRRTVLVIAVWLWVTVPFAYGVFELSTKVVQLFRQ